MFLRKKKKNGLEKEKKDSTIRTTNAFDEEPEVDSEGFTIRKHLDQNNVKNLDKFYSSSDESDTERENEKKLHFEIKPRNGFDPKNSSVDELKQTVKQLSIAPPLNTKKQIDSLRTRLKKRNQVCYFDGTLKRSTSQNVINLNNSNQRLTDLNLKKNGNFNSSLSNLHSTFNNQLTNKTEFPQLNNLILNKPQLKDESNNNQSNQSNNQPNQSNQLNDSNSSNNSQSKNQPTEDRYAALRAFFDNEKNDESKDDKMPIFNQESNLVKSTSLSKSISSFSAGNMNLLLNKNEQSNEFSKTINGNKSNLMSRCESYSSLSTDLRMTPVSICSSRGPSPLNLGSNNTSIPIAVAIQELVNARFKGSDETKCSSTIFGILKIAFPTGILQILMNQSQVDVLIFKLVNASKLSKIHCNKGVILSYKKCGPNNSEIQFEVSMDGLIKSLKQSFERSPAARYFNVDILKYQLETGPGTQSCPLQVVTHWKCEPQSTCLKIDYKYNSHALSSLEPLRNVAFSVKVDNVVDFQSKPQANWNSSTKQVCWKIDQISRLSEGYGLGSLRAKFTVNNGPTNPQPVLIQLHSANSTFSGVNFELLTSAYRLSCIKKQISTGQYISEADSTINYVSV